MIKTINPQQIIHTRQSQRLYNSFGLISIQMYVNDIVFAYLFKSRNEPQEGLQVLQFVLLNSNHFASFHTLPQILHSNNMIIHTKSLLIFMFAYTWLDYSLKETYPTTWGIPNVDVLAHTNNLC